MKVEVKHALSMFFTAVAFAGCAPVGTSEVATDEMYAAYSITASAEATLVRAQFFRYGPVEGGGEGTSDSLQLDGGDRVEVTLNGVTQPLEVDPTFVDHGILGMGPHFFVYAAQLPPATDDDEVVVVMTRGDGVVLESSNTVPPVPTFTPVPERFSRDEGLTLVGDGDFDGDFLQGELLGELCFSNWGTGSEGARLEFEFDQTSEEECEISLVVRRTRFGQGNPAYSLSDIEVNREAAPLTVLSTP